MKRWMIDDIPEDFREALRSGATEPQLVYDRETPVAAILDIELLRRLAGSANIAALLDKLDAVEVETPDDGDITDEMGVSDPLHEPGC